jgi:DNA invertase Pin-like site-specific DNA recombinase
MTTSAPTVSVPTATPAVDAATQPSRRLGSLAEYERELIRAASRDKGTKFERPKKVADANYIASAKRMKADGHTGRDIAKYLGVSRATLYRYLDDSPASAA